MTRVKSKIPIPYPSYVKVKKPLVIKSEILETRRYLRGIIDNSLTETILYILMNPSAADADYSDDTVNNLLNYSKSLNKEEKYNIKNVIITNIIPIYESDSKEIKEKYNSITKKEIQELNRINLKTIRRAITFSDYIVVAWGNPYINEVEHRNITSNILKILNDISQQKELFVFKFDNDSPLTVKGHPQHLGYIKKNISLEPVKIKPFYYVVEE